MGFFDRLFGRQPAPPAQPAPGAAGRLNRGGPVSDDAAALERYRYMLRTAPPETIEQAHEEAFAQLTPSQRAQVLRDLSDHLPAHERATAPRQADPRTLARMATRAEMRQPGFMERTFGGAGGGMGMGGMMAGTIFGSLVAGFAGSMIAHQFMDSVAHDPTMAEGGMDEGSGETEMMDASQEDTGGFEDDLGGDDFGGGDF
jgi:hypothetical protein